MKHFLANYSSDGNLEKGQIHIQAKNIVEAQNKFFDYLEKTELYGHMWNLNLNIVEIKDSI